MAVILSLRNNKVIVLRQLSLESEPISLPELMTCLGENFKKRSVRRWLDLLVEEGAVKKIGRKRGTKYIAIRRSNEENGELSSCFSSTSSEVIKVVKRSLFEKPPVPYANDWFAQLLTAQACKLATDYC